MRQTTTNEKMDPLARIQEEIKEVERREQEYRQLKTANMNNEANEAAATLEANVLTVNDLENENNKNRLQSLSPTPLASEDCISSMPSSLIMSVSSNSSSIGKDDDHHSDDSGISASSTNHMNAVSANIKKFNEIPKKVNNIIPKVTKTGKETRYVRPNCYNMTPEPPQQKLMTRAVSTPHLNAIKTPLHFNLGPSQKGVMQRFIAARGKIQLRNNNNNNNNRMYLNGSNAGSLVGLNGIGMGVGMMAPPNTPALNNDGIPLTIINNITLTPPVIERDSEGRPIRPGYVPVELKIQRELQDLKSRENELKKIRKIRESTSDLLNSIDNENVETDDEVNDDNDVEHCYGPRKLRAAKSIGDMCDSSQNNSLTLSVSPLPDMDKSIERSEGRNEVGGMRPAMSLAQLCDLDPDEAPSSRGLIAQWENLIQQNA